VPHVSLRVTEEERNMMEGYARVQGVSLSEAIKAIFFQMLEDDYDLRAISEYEAEKAKGTMKYYSLDEVKSELGFE